MEGKLAVPDGLFSRQHLGFLWRQGTQDVAVARSESPVEVVLQMCNRLKPLASNEETGPSLVALYDMA